MDCIELDLRNTKRFFAIGPVVLLQLRYPNMYDRTNRIGYRRILLTIIRSLYEGMAPGLKLDRGSQQLLDTFLEKIRLDIYNKKNRPSG
jgi:hypothetical protein